jgi:hypothetical protein
MWHNRYVSPNAYTAWLMPFSLKSFTLLIRINYMVSSQLLSELQL